MPYDQFVAAILTAQGNVSDSPPVVWYREVRNIGPPGERHGQLFLGTRINCANCHHHPYENWSQDDYWGLAALLRSVGKQARRSGQRERHLRPQGRRRQPAAHRQDR